MAKARKDIKKSGTGTPAIIHDSPITHTLETNYMPYVMSVIVSRAIPEIDGFKPAHRKLLYTMFKMGLLTGNRIKSADVVGQTMKLNPHGDGAIYETLVRLTRGNEALLHPFIDSKGSFGKQYSKMAYAASRYTEVKLDLICQELFSGIDKDAVDMMDNYNGTTKEPVLFPTSFPNVLVSPNTGIAVGLASSICSFNLAEMCETTIALIQKPQHDLSATLPAPDFSTGAQLLYNKHEMDAIYSSGRGSIRLRSKYRVVPNQQCIEIYEIPYSTTVEAIIDKIAKLVKGGKLKEINDVRDETDLGGLKLTIDIKRGVEPDKLMAKLFKRTDLECNFPCNFNILIGGTPRLMGIREILQEWHGFRCECLKREIYFDLMVKNDKLHVLMGLEKILLDIDKAISIIRKTENDKDVIPNLCKGFDIDEPQAEFIADIRLRNLNKEHILSRVAEMDTLKAEIKRLEGILKSEQKLNNLIIEQLRVVQKKYGIPRKTEIISGKEAQLIVSEEKEEAYQVYVVMTKEGYFKRITLQSIRGSDDQKLKDGDEIVYSGEISSECELLFFTDQGQLYKAKVGEFENVKASALGEYVPAKLEFEANERVIFFMPEINFEGRLMIGFENGKALSIPLSQYQTKTNRRKLTGVFNITSPVVGMIPVEKGKTKDVFILTKHMRAAYLPGSLIPEKATRTSAGNQIFVLKKGDYVEKFVAADQIPPSSLKGCRKLKVPTPGAIYNPVNVEENQLIME